MFKGKNKKLVNTTSGQGGSCQDREAAARTGLQEQDSRTTGTGQTGKDSQERTGSTQHTQEKN